MIFDKQIPNNLRNTTDVYIQELKSLYTALSESKSCLVPTINIGESEDKYFDGPGYSQSQMKDMLKGVEYYHRGRNKLNVSSAAQEKGTAVHKHILNPRFSLDFGTDKEISSLRKNTKAYKEQLQEWIDKEKRLFIDYDLYYMIETCVNKFNRLYSFNRDKLIIEMPMYYFEKEVLIKTKPDFYDPETNTVYDFKTTSSYIDSRTNVLNIIKYGYHFQAFVYCNAYARQYGTRPNFKIIWIESSPPYTFTESEINQDFQMKAMTDYMIAIEKYISYCNEERNPNRHRQTGITKYNPDPPRWLDSDDFLPF